MVETYPAFLGRPRLLSAAGGGTSLSTTKAWIPIPAGTKHITLVPRNYSTAVVAKVTLNPFITVIKTNDSINTAPTNYSENAQDGDAATLVTLSSMPTLANGGALYIGAADLFGGLMATLVATNSGGGTMAVHYWNGTAWTALTITDNTTNLNASAIITWTMPTDWVSASLSGILNRFYPGVGQDLFWVRVTTSAAYDASTTLSSLYAVSRWGDSVMELVTGHVFQTAIDRQKNGGVVQAATDAGTANLIVTGYY